MPKNGSGGAAQPLPQSSRTHGARKDIYLKMHRAYGTLHKAVFAARIKIYEKERVSPLPRQLRLQKLSQQVQCSQSHVFPTWMVVSSQCIPSRLYLQSVTPQETPLFMPFCIFPPPFYPDSICVFYKNIGNAIDKRADSL